MMRLGVVLWAWLLVAAVLAIDTESPSLDDVEFGPSLLEDALVFEQEEVAVGSVKPVVNADNVRVASQENVDAAPTTGGKDGLDYVGPREHGSADSAQVPRTSLADKAERQWESDEFGKGEAADAAVGNSGVEATAGSNRFSLHKVVAGADREMSALSKRVDTDENASGTIAKVRAALGVLEKDRAYLFTLLASSPSTKATAANSARVTHRRDETSSETSMDAIDDLPAADELRLALKKIVDGAELGHLLTDAEKKLLSQPANEKLLQTLSKDVEAGLVAARQSLRRIEAARAWIAYEERENAGRQAASPVMALEADDGSRSGSASSQSVLWLGVAAVVASVLLIVGVVYGVKKFVASRPRAEEVVFVGPEWTASISEFRGPLLGTDSK